MPVLSTFGSIILGSHYLGLPLKVVSPILLILLLIPHRSRADRPGHNRFFEISFRYLIYIYPVFVFAIQLARLKSGSQGVDFAIFSQSVHNVSHRKGLETSLIDWNFRHFLTHHFSPYLFVVGAINRIFDSAEVVLLALHSITIAAILRYLFLITHHITRDRALAYAVCCLAMVLPAPRIGLLWEVRDEIFGLPFLLGAYSAFLRGHHRTALFHLLATFLFKETMLIASAVFCVMAIIKLSAETSALSRRLILLYIMTAIISVGAFLTYTKLLPGWIFTPTFSPHSRISSRDQFFAWPALTDKLYWGGILIAPHLPLLGIGLYQAKRASSKIAYLRRLAIMLIPATPFIGMIVVSNFSASYNPYNYYSIVPSILLLTGIIASLGARDLSGKERVIIGSCLIAICIGPRGRFPRELKRAITLPSPVTSLHSVIPPEATVVTGDYDTTFFVRNAKVTRLFHANRNRLPFDFIVQRKTGPGPSATVPLTRYLIDHSRPCFEDDHWFVRCSKSSLSGTRGERIS